MENIERIIVAGSTIYYNGTELPPLPLHHPYSSVNMTTLNGHLS